MNTYGTPGVTYGGVGTYGSWGAVPEPAVEQGGGRGGRLQRRRPDDEDALIVAALL